MTRTPFNDFNCSLARTADIIGDKWTLLILRDAFFGATTFSQFQKNLGVARNILANRLDKLVSYQVMERRQSKPGVERYSYHLTERGLALVPVLVAMTQWGDSWVLGEGNEPIEFRDRNSGQKIAPLRVLSGKGEPLDTINIEVSPGPGADERIRKTLSTTDQTK
jgi:DNA-binding HxlR family transcriptional regulator